MSRRIIFTAGVHSGRIAPRKPRSGQTDYQGVLNTLAAAREAELRGRFLYMNSIGVTTPSLAASLLNLLKRNTLVWRRRVEDEHPSRVVWTTRSFAWASSPTAPRGQRAVEVSQGSLPLAPRHRIARADVAEAFVAALPHPRASRATFEIVWGKGPRRADWGALLSRLQPDA